MNIQSIDDDPPTLEEILLAEIDQAGKRRNALRRPPSPGIWLARAPNPLPSVAIVLVFWSKVGEATLEYAHLGDFHSSSLWGEALKPAIGNTVERTWTAHAITQHWTHRCQRPAWTQWWLIASDRIKIA